MGLPLIFEKIIIVDRCEYLLSLSEAKLNGKGRLIRVMVKLGNGVG